MYANKHVLGALLCGAVSFAPGVKGPSDRAFGGAQAQEAKTPQRLNGLSAAQSTSGQGFSAVELTSDDNWPENDLVSDRTENAAQRVEELSGRFRSAVGEDAKSRVTFAKTALETVERGRAELGSSSEWWDQKVIAPLSEDERPVSGQLADYIYSAIANSEQIKVFGDLPAIRDTGILEAEGRFVPEAFAEARIEERDEFSTSVAQTSGEDRLRRDEREIEFGLRTRLRTGGEVTLAQRFTDIDTNETDFAPNQEQARSRLVLTLLQPLLRGAGTTMGNAPTEIARLDADIARFEFWRQTEGHLLEVERSYWALYLARSEFLQLERLASRTAGVASRLAGRSEIDADQVLITRAAAAATARRADLVRAKTAVSNAEARLAGLLNDPDLGGFDFELLPLTSPGAALRPVEVGDLVEDVLRQRPEVQQAFLQHRASIIREGVAANEALPQLDLVLEGRFEGGANDRDFGDSFDNGINDGFGYLAGLRFSVPLGYDERAARRDRRRIETRQQERQVNVVLATAFLDLEVAINEYSVALEDVKFARLAHQSARRELNVLDQRWNAGALESGGLALLSALLDAQQSLQAAERNVASNYASMEIASANLARARGGLLDRWGVTLNEVEGRRGQPTYRPGLSD